MLNVDKVPKLDYPRGPFPKNAKKKKKNPVLRMNQRAAKESWQFEPRHDKTNKMSVQPAKTQINLGIRHVWSESSLCAQWVAKDPSFLHADSKDSDQTGRVPRLIWVLAGCTAILLVLSCRGSAVYYILILVCDLHVLLLSHIMRKPVFRVSDQVRLKPYCSATEAS